MCGSVLQQHVYGHVVRIVLSAHLGFHPGEPWLGVVMACRLHGEPYAPCDSILQLHVSSLMVLTPGMVVHSITVLQSWVSVTLLHQLSYSHGHYHSLHMGNGDALHVCCYRSC